MSGTCPSCEVVVPPGHSNCIWCGEALGGATAAQDPDRVETFYDEHGNDGPSTLRLRDTGRMAALRPTDVLLGGEALELASDEPHAPKPLVVFAVLAALALAGVATGALLGHAVLGPGSEAAPAQTTPSGAIVEAPATLE